MVVVFKGSPWPKISLDVSIVGANSISRVFSVYEECKNSIS